MDNIIHINVELHKTDSKYVAVTKTRLWTYIPPTLNWIVRSKIPGSNSIQGGISFIIINNLAILVEGFITDILISEIDNHELIKPRQVQNIINSSWKNKVKQFKRIFKKDLRSLPNFEAIEILFNFRNNFSHGRSYLEISEKDISTGESSPLWSPDNNYQKAREFLIKNKFLDPLATQTNILFWKLNVAIFFYGKVKSFLFDVINNVDFKGKESILSELKTGYNGSI